MQHLVLTLPGRGGRGAHTHTRTHTETLTHAATTTQTHGPQEKRAHKAHGCSGADINWPTVRQRAPSSTAPAGGGDAGAPAGILYREGTLRNTQTQHTTRGHAAKKWHANTPAHIRQGEERREEGTAYYAPPHNGVEELGTGRREEGKEQASRGVGRAGRDVHREGTDRASALRLRAACRQASHRARAKTLRRHCAHSAGQPRPQVRGIALTE